MIKGAFAWGKRGFFGFGDGYLTQLIFSTLTN